ncbi:MAG: hypothetical protein M3P00_03355, partial [Gemmatimonadota bacterium]|nr:hypothetical protein [Gemmatimonadota bacterium]
MTIASTSTPVGRTTTGKGPVSRARVEMPPCDHKPKPYTGPSREELVAMRRRYTNPAVFTLYGEPL